MKDNLFEQLDFGAFQEYIDDDDITDISYTNNGQLWLRSLTQGSKRVENENINNSVVEKLAFQCSNVMGVSFNNANPFLDAESPELRMNFVHDSIATNGIALVIRKTPAKIRLKEETLLEEDYVTKDIHDFLIKCVHGHCNIIVCGETGSGKTELVKYLASKIAEDEKIITIEDTLELHLDKIFPHRDIVAMKTNNIASYTDVLVTCMRQNPKWILLSEVRSAEAVLAVRNSISSGHYILSTIHADKAASIPNRMYSLLETSQEIEQFLATIHRYVQIGIYVRGYTDKNTHNFVREIAEVTEFYVTEDNKPESNTIYRKSAAGNIIRKNPSKHLIDYLEVQGVFLPKEMELLGENIPISEGEHEKVKQMYQSNDKPAEALLFGNQKTVSQPVNQTVQRPVGQTVQSVNSTPIVNQPAQRTVQPAQPVNQTPVGQVPVQNTVVRAVQTGPVSNQTVRTNENLFE